MKAKTFLSIDEKRAHLAALAKHVAEGGTERSFARETGLQQYNFYRWKEQVAKADQAEATPQAEPARLQGIEIGHACLAAEAATGQSVASFAREQGIKPPLVYYWRDKARKAAAKTPARNGTAEQLHPDLEPKLRLCCPKCGCDLIEHSKRTTKKLEQIARDL